MKGKNKIGILLRMLGLVKPLAGFMVLAVTLGTCGFLTAILIPVLGGLAVLCGLGFQIPFSLRSIYILLLLCAVARAVFRLSEQRTNHYIAFTLLAIIRDRVFRALRRLCPAKLEGRDKGDLISVITSDVELLEVFYAHTVSPICIAFFVELIMCIVIGSFHWSMGLLAFLAYLSIGVFLPLWISGHSGSLGEELRRQSGELAAHMLESIRGIDDTLQFRGGDQRLREITNRTKELSEKQGELSRLTGINLALSNSLILFFDICMLILCVFLYREGLVAFDGVVIPLIALMSSYGPVTALSALGTTLQNTIASGARVLAIIDEMPEVEEISGQPEIEFHGARAERVQFSYGGNQVLRDFSFSIPENRILGIIGKSGCGKSTFLKLLMRFWKADQGELLITDRSIERVNTANLRELEGYMTQDTVLFQDTIANNIRIAKLDATQEEIREACRKASIDEFIQTLPEGYETQVGELGSTLSGGERQRIGLARAFLHDAPLLLLDEPTSNLDSLNEAIVLKSLGKEKENRTILLVSHRQSTMRIADETYRMESIQSL